MDDERRAAEKQAGTGEPIACLAYARALCRSGRSDEALNVLLPAVGHAEVRREIGCFPAWTHPDGDAGRTRWIDASPIRRAPEVRWVSERNFSIAEQSGGTSGRWPRLMGPILASPLGVVVGTSEDIQVSAEAEQSTVIEGRTYVLDPDSGAVRASLPGTPLWIEDGLLVVAECQDTRVYSPEGQDMLSIGGSSAHISIRDLFTGEESARTQILNERVLPEDGGHVFSLHDWDLHSLSYLRQPGIRAGSFAKMPDCKAHVVTGDLVCLSMEGNEVHVLDKTARPLWRSEGRAPLADAAGIVVITGFDSSRRDWGGVIGLYSKTGALLRREASSVAPYALTPKSLLARSDRGDLVVLDRATLEPRATSASWSRPPAAARDVIYAPGDSGIVAIQEETGDVLWKLERRELGDAALAPLSRRLFGLTGDGGVFCIEEPSR